jgi:hypothetical protein
MGHVLTRISWWQNVLLLTGRFSFEGCLVLKLELNGKCYRTCFRGVCLSSEEDKISWGLTASRKFTTGSLYKFMTLGGICSRTVKYIWNCKVPMKIRIFLWQVFQNRILTAQQLCSRNWKGEEQCAMCSFLFSWLNHV